MVTEPAATGPFLSTVDDGTGPDELTWALDKGERALAAGDPAASRPWFVIAYQAAGERGDAVAMARAALGLGGVWGTGDRSTTGAALQRSRLRRALDARPADPSLVRRLRGRLAADRGDPGPVLDLAREARAAGDHEAWVDLAGLAHHRMLGPDHAAGRHRLALDLVAEGAHTGHPAVQRLGLMWRTVDLLLDGDPRADAALAELRASGPSDRHDAAGTVVRAVDVMLGVRAGRLAWAGDEADRLARAGVAAGDPHAPRWHASQILAVRWYQGRLGDTVPRLTDLAASGSGDDRDAVTAVLAVATALAGDHRRAAGALARLGGGDLGRVSRTGTWPLTLYAAVEAAALLGDVETSRTAYDLLLPFADRPMVASLGAVCLGSTHHALGVAALTLGRPGVAVTHLRRALRANLALEHWPAVAMTRWRLAEALDPVDGPEEAAALRTTARREADELGLRLPDSGPPPRSGLSWRRGGTHWTVTLGSRTAHVRDGRGVRYLAVLTANADREILAATLVSGLAGDWDGGTPPAPQPVLDDVARRRYQARLAELTEAIETTGDVDRHDRLTHEREWLLRELAAAAGFGGRAKTFVTNEERARIAVGKAIRRAIGQLDRVCADIAGHLREHVRTGRYCVYLTDL
jgi:hypothetical protein